MSFFERAKAAATDFAAKADQAMANAGVSTPGAPGGSPDRALRDLGVVAWLDTVGRPVAPADRERVMSTLRELESAGRLTGLAVSPPPAAPPPPPGAAGSWSSSTDAAPPAPAAPPAADPGRRPDDGSLPPPPPPPSWA
ncbi:MAG: hypothetical protein ACRCXL_14185 [Dermatophilaceae bacterium]